MIYIDGSEGEGGGQVLRTALGLSLVSGRPFTIANIRGKRKKPGLMRQHLTAVLAATEIGDAEVQGAAVGSQHLTFTPKTIVAGKYRFAIGTAGSCTLVLQAILPALLVADGSSQLVLEGGTHNPMAPPFDFLEASFAPLIKKMGADIRVELERPGFFPAGGGKISVAITPGKLRPLDLRKRTGETIRAKAICAQLPGHIGQRELKTVKSKLPVADEHLEQVMLDKYGPGNVLSLFVQANELTETFTGFGQKNVSAEKVARKVVKEVQHYLQSPAPVGPYLADQLLVPMTLAGSGLFITSRLSSHSRTNIAVVEKFCDVKFKLEKIAEDSWQVEL